MSGNTNNYCRCSHVETATETDRPIPLFCRRCFLFLEPSDPSAIDLDEVKVDKEIKDEVCSAFEDATYQPSPSKYRGYDANRRVTIDAESTRRQGQEKIIGLIEEHGKDTICECVHILLCESSFSSLHAVARLFAMIFPDCSIDDLTKEAPKVENLLPPSLPSLFPAYLPFKTQHQFMGKLQDYLESLCYAFVQKTMPETLQKRGWVCAESAQLNQWMDVFIHADAIFESGDSSESSEKLFKSVAEIRNIAVERKPIDSKGMKKVLSDAVALAELLNVKEHHDIIADFQRVVNKSLEDLHKNKHELRSKLEEELSNIALERAKLKEREDAAIAEMCADDQKHQNLTGTKLLLVLGRTNRSISRSHPESYKGIEEEWNDDSDGVATPGSDE